MKRWASIVALAAVLILAAVLVVVRPGRDPAPAPEIPLASSMAAIGDSITAGVGAAPNQFGIASQHNWSTGAATDEVVSHYERLLAPNPAIQGRNHNLAVPGAKMADAPEQARDAVARGVAYVTILLGANDVCAATVDSMTPVAQFERDFSETLDILSRGLADAHFFVVSVPDVHRLWDIFGDDPIARQVWEAAGICPPILDPQTTEGQRRLARERNIAYNRVLQEGCAKYQRCLFDDNAVFDYAFGREHVAIDFFHPSQLGHKVLAEITWEHSFWPNL